MQKSESSLLNITSTLLHSAMCCKCVVIKSLSIYSNIFYCFRFSIVDCIAFHSWRFFPIFFFFKCKNAQSSCSSLPSYPHTRFSVLDLTDDTCTFSLKNGDFEQSDHRSKYIFSIVSSQLVRVCNRNVNFRIVLLHFSIPFETREKKTDFQQRFCHFILWWIRIGFKIRRCENVAFFQLAIDNVEENIPISVEIIRLFEWISTSCLRDCGNLCVCGRRTISVVWGKIHGCSENNNRMKTRG